MKTYNTIFDFIKSEEEKYKKAVKLSTGKTWSMKDHINRSVLYRDSDIEGTKGDFTPIKNITRPILNLQYRTEDIDVKDVQIYVNDSDKYHLSFLVKKYHDDVFTVENDIDTFFDRLNQARIDFGGALSKRLSSGREAVPMESIVFCDQRDILSRPIGLKHSYSPDELLAMGDKGWGKTANGATASLKDVIILARNGGTKDDVSEGDIQVYEVHGNLPKRFSDSADDSEEYETRIYICCFYTKPDSTEKQGIILYTKPEPESPFKLCKRGVGIYGRALDFGGAEEIAEDQVWVNYAQIRKIDMMDAASKTIILSEDPAFTQKNKVTNMSNLEVADVEQGKKVYQMDTFPRNFKLFDNLITELEAHAKNMGAAEDPIQGGEPMSGTAFASLQTQIQQGMGLHDYRKGIFAKHLEEIYEDDYIPQIIEGITKGAKFLSDLSLEEMQYVCECLVRTETEKAKKEFVLANAGVAPTPDVVAQYEQKVRDEFNRKGSKHFIEILKGEFKDAPLAVKVTIDGKSKNLSKMTDKIVSIFKFAFSNPQGFAQTMQIPGMAKSFNQMLEFSGLSPVDFAGIDKLAIAQPQQPQQGQPQPSPMQPQPMAP